METDNAQAMLASEIDEFIEAYLKWHHRKKTQAANTAAEQA